MIEPVLLALLDYLNKNEEIDFEVLDELELIYNFTEEELYLLLEEIKSVKTKTTRYATNEELLQILYLEYHDALHEYEFYHDVAASGISLDNELVGEVILEQEVLLNRIDLYSKIFNSYQPKKRRIR